MTLAARVSMSPRMEEAVTELIALIRGRFPEATFAIGHGEDPDGIYLTAMVDVDDRGEVIDVFIERLIDLQLEEGLPLFVAPVRTPERNAALLARKDSPARAPLLI